MAGSKRDPPADGDEKPTVALVRKAVPRAKRQVADSVRVQGEISASKTAVRKLIGAAVPKAKHTVEIRQQALDEIGYVGGVLGTGRNAITNIAGIIAIVLTVVIALIVVPALVAFQFMYPKESLLIPLITTLLAGGDGRHRVPCRHKDRQAQGLTRRGT